MNTHVHPHMLKALAPALVHRSVHPADRLSARIDATAYLKLDGSSVTYGVTSIEGSVRVYRDHGRICIDDIEIECVSGTGPTSLPIGTHFDTMRGRSLTRAEMQEHVYACAFLDLTDDPDFIESAEIALEKASQP